MIPDQTSRTAVYMAFYRALESARPAAKRLFCDPFARHFLRPFLLKTIGLSRVPLLGAILYWYADRRAPGARTSAIARTRLIDEAWCQALRDGIRQIVILGSGFDCRPYRLPGAPSAIIFEVDIPERSPRNSPSSTSHLMPENVHYVEIDFHHRGLAETLVDAGFEASLPGLFIWEGVTNYLTLEAVGSVFRYVGTLSPGCRIVFTYVHGGVLDGSVNFEGAENLLRGVAQLGEPWTFGLCPSQVPDFLRTRGLELDSDLGAQEYRVLYFGHLARANEGM